MARTFYILKELLYYYPVVYFGITNDLKIKWLTTKMVYYY